MTMPLQSRPEKSFEAQKMYEKGMKLVDISRQLGLPDSTVRVWKKKYNWEKELKKKQNKSRAMMGNKNGVNSPTKFKPGNTAALTTGFFSRYLPQETKEIIMQMENNSPLNMLWDQILIAYAAILRAQKIMFVEDRDDKTIEKVSQKDGDTVTETRWTVQQAWDKQAQFLKSQSMAQAELRGMIKQYLAILDSNPELVREEQQARIEKLKVMISAAKGEHNQEELDKLDKVLGEIKGVI